MKTLPLSKYWLFWVDPLRSVSKDHLASTRLLNSIALLMLFGLPPIALWTWLGTPYRLFALVASGAALAAYIASRRGYASYARIPVILIFALSPIVLLVSLGSVLPGAVGYPSELINLSVLYVVVALCVIFLLCEPRGAAFYCIIVNLELMALPALLPVEPHHLLLPLTVSIIVSLFVLIGTGVKHMHVRAYERQEQALRDSELRHRILFETMQDAVVVHRSGTPVMVNDAFTALFGHTRADMRVDGIHVDALFAHAPSHTEPDLQTLPALRADGSTFWCEVQVRQLEIGTETLCVYIMRDITARLLLEAQQLELSVEREKVNVLQQFIGNLSHDFRTPLSVMKTSLYLIDRLREAPEKREAQFGVLREQVAHVQTLLDDLLQMAKLDRGNTSDYRYAWRDVSAIVRALADEQQKELLRKHQHLVLDLADGLPLVLVDENAIGRMLKHLLRNALVYTAEHGTITLRTRMESDAEQRRWAVIDIEDTGTGIDPRDLPYIFDRFYRADAARPTREGGTGVGLTIARRIAEVHEGTITVESRPGVGSVFHVRLPIVHRLAREAAPHTPLASARAETSEVAPQRAGSLSEMPSDAPRTSERSAIA